MQVNPIRNLYRIRGNLADCRGISSGLFARNGSDMWILLQPCFKCAIKERYRVMHRFIHNDGTIDMLLIEGKIVDADCGTAYLFGLFFISSQQ